MLPSPGPHRKLSGGWWSCPTAIKPSNLCIFCQNIWIPLKYQGECGTCGKPNYSLISRRFLAYFWQLKEIWLPGSPTRSLGSETSQDLLGHFLNHSFRVWHRTPPWWGKAVFSVAAITQTIRYWTEKTLNAPNFIPPSPPKNRTYFWAYSYLSMPNSGLFVNANLSN